MRDINDLKQRLVSVRAELKQTVVDQAIDQWQTRLRACIRAKGQHFEQLLNRLVAGADPGILERGPDKGAKPRTERRRRDRRRGVWGLPQKISKN